MFDATDRADGGGINVTLTDYPVDSVNVIEVQDTALDNWRDTVTVNGNGLGTIPMGDTDATVDFTRSYWVRVRTIVGGVVVGYSTPILVSPTQGYKSYAFEMIMQLKHALINLSIARVGGRVFSCIDPRVYKSLPSVPCIFIFQATPETVTAADNSASFVDLPIAVQIADSMPADFAGNVEWWLYARQTVFDQMHRICTEKFSNTGSGRRWRIEPGPLLADGDPSDYLWRASQITMRADLERPIGG